MYIMYISYRSIGCSLETANTAQSLFEQPNSTSKRTRAPQDSNALLTHPPLPRTRFTAERVLGPCNQCVVSWGGGRGVYALMLR